VIPVLTGEEMRAIDAAAPDPVEVLIQRAGAAVARVALEEMGGAYGRRVVVVAGKGNNGADGRAAAAMLRRRGVRVAVDDFGSGYSSLGQLRRLPVDMLKIDREFLREARSAQATALLRAVVELGNGLGLTVVAEGVERQDQLALVRGVGCPLGQGWLWARPMAMDDITTLLGP
jgi:EAL domain-containing protein (putative c-di-GMP-specific phosphodiesterase class I)